MARRTQNSSARSVANLFLVAIIVLAVAGIGFAGWKLAVAIGADFGGGRSGNAVETPNVLNVEESKAAEMIRSAGLEPVTVRSDFNDVTPRGQVYQQNPEGGMAIKAGRKVSIFVSLGPASFVVPDLSGEHINNAGAKLAKAGFSLGSVQKVYTRQFPSGRIINQNPKTGQDFSGGVPVDVVIADSTNAPDVSMPSITGQPLASAEEILTHKEYNLQLALVQYVADDSSPPGTVLRQEPPAGKEVPMGSRVQVDVAATTEYMNQKQRTVNLKIPVPNGPDQQEVKIKFSDDLGDQVKLDEKHNPGEVIEVSIDLEGKASIMIFVGDMKNPLRVEKF